MLFLAGNTNKALCSAAILAVLDTLYAMRLYLQGSKNRDGGSNRNLNGKSAKETMLLEMRVHQGMTAFYH